MQLSKEDILAQTDLMMPSSNFNIVGFYFIAAHTDSGMRLYSDPLYDLDYAEKEYEKYVGVVEYFEGGSVVLYKINDDDYDIISYTKI